MNPSRRSALAIAALLLSAAAPLVAQTPPSRATIVQRLDSLARSGVMEGRVVGLSVAVVHGRDTLLMKGYGRADLELDVPTPERAVYEIGSVTKQFTAAAVLQLRDEGKIDLDAEITRYLPAFPTQGRRVTVRRLLDHTSGIRGATEIPEFAALVVRDLPRDTLVALIARQPFDFEPGAAMIYNNSAYVLLGHIIEKVSGMSYEDYVEKHIFERLGMKDSHYCDNSAVVKGRASGYAITAQGTRRGSYVNHAWPFSAGSLCSTTGDMITWLRALHGGRALSQSSYHEMITGARLNDGTELRYGMGLTLGTDVRGARQIGHGGSVASGFNAYTQYYPDHDVMVVVLMNSSGPISPAAIAVELAAEIVPATRPNLRTFSGDGAPLIGRYSGRARGQAMTVEVTEWPQGGLGISVNGGQARPLPWIDGLRFRVGDNLLTFERPDANGPPALLRFDAANGYYMLRR